MHGLRIPDIAQRDRFIRRVVAERCAYAVTTADGLARVRAPADPERSLVLVWSTEVEASRWSPSFPDGQPVKVGLAQLLEVTLPEFALSGHGVGVDWTADPLEVAFEATELRQRLSAELLHAFSRRARTIGGVWLLDTGTGPVKAKHPADPERSLLPCWSDAALAEAVAIEEWHGLKPKLMPTETFTTVALPWLRDHGWQVSLDHTRAEVLLTVSANDLAYCFEKT